MRLMYAEDGDSKRSGFAWNLCQYFSNVFLHDIPEEITRINCKNLPRCLLVVAKASLFLKKTPGCLAMMERCAPWVLDPWAHI